VNKKTVISPQLPPGPKGTLFPVPSGRSPF